MNNRSCIVYSYYVLDLVHAGHLLYMKAAKALAGKNGTSVVGILTDKAVMERKRKTVLSFSERIGLAEAIRYNDYVVGQETYSPLANIESIRPDVILESMSHKPEDLEKVRKCAKKIGARLVINPYFPDQSSNRIKKQIKEIVQ